MEISNKIIQEIKKDFFRYRNGIVAEALRKLYPINKMIFGLTVPQLIEIAKKYPKDIDLGLKLWRDKNNRESRLLSLYLIHPEELDRETVLEMINDVESTEDAEFLAFKILRKLPFAEEFYNEISSASFSQYPAYCMKMFRKNLDHN